MNRRATASAHSPPPRIQRSAFRARNVHSASEEIGDEGAQAQNGRHERDLEQG